MSILSKLFYPTSIENSFDVHRYIADIENGKFEDLFNLGITQNKGGDWVLKNFVEEPNAIFVGSMGSGKSMAAAFTLSTWLMSNSEKTIVFIADTLKDANDYSAMFEFDQVYPITSNNGRDPIDLLARTIDLAFSEGSARKLLFSEYSAINYADYEKKSGKGIPRIVIMIEEFHSVPYQQWEFDKNFKTPHTTAHKFFQLMRTGRSYGIFFCVASQKSTKSDMPPEVVGNFTNKNIFKVSQAESSYVINSTEPARLLPSQKGRCYNDLGAVQYPYLPVEAQRKLLKRFVKPLKAQCAYMTKDLISSYLAGNSSIELYRLRKMVELAEGLEGFDGELVLELIHDKIGNKTEKIESKTDNFGACMIVTTPSGEKNVVLYRKKGAKVSHKTINNLARAIRYYKCNGGLLYYNGDHLTPSLYREAESMNIKIYDTEDLILIAQQIDAGKIDMIHQLERDLANTDEIPGYIPKDLVRRAQDPNDGELITDEQPDTEDNESPGGADNVDELKSMLLGEDPAVARALEASKRRKALDAEKKKIKLVTNDQ